MAPKPPPSQTLVFANKRKRGRACSGFAVSALDETVQGQPDLVAAALRRGNWWWPALRQGMAKLTDAALWEILLQTEQQASLVFQSLARVMGGVFDFLIARFRTYPLRLVDLLEGGFPAECAIAELLSSPECLLDEFTSKFRRENHTAEQLSSEEAKMALRVLLGEVSGTTYDVECAHSRNLCRQRARTMTHNIEMSDLGVGFAALSTPSVIGPLFKAQRNAQQQASNTSAKRKKKGRRRRILACVCTHAGTVQGRLNLESVREPTSEH